MTRQQRLLSQLRKLEEKLTTLHDQMNEKFGSSNEFVQMSMYCYVMSLSCVMEIEGFIEDDGGFGEG